MERHCSYSKTTLNVISVKGGMAGYAAGWGGRIRLLRDTLGLSQADAAEKADADAAQWSRWETERMVPRSRALRSIAGITDDPDGWYKYLREGGTSPADQPGIGIGDVAQTELTPEEAIRLLEMKLESAVLERRGMAANEVLQVFALYRFARETQEPATPAPAAAGATDEKDLAEVVDATERDELLRQQGLAPPAKAGGRKSASQEQPAGHGQAREQKRSRRNSAGNT